MESKYVSNRLTKIDFSVTN